MPSFRALAKDSFASSSIALESSSPFLAIMIKPSRPLLVSSVNFLPSLVAKNSGVSVAFLYLVRSSKRGSVDYSKRKGRNQVQIL